MKPRGVRCGNLLRALALALINDLESLLGGLDTTENHGTEGRAHAVRAVDLSQLHTTHDETLGDLTGVLDDGVLGGVHVQTTHATEFLDGGHGDEALGGEGAEGAVVAGGGDHQRSVDSVGVHAGVVVVVQADQGPVGDNTSNADIRGVAGVGWASDHVLNGGSVEKLDVGEEENLGQDGGGEQGGVLNHNVVGVGILLVRDSELLQEDLSGATHDHGGEELTTEPGTTTYINYQINVERRITRIQ